MFNPYPIPNIIVGMSFLFLGLFVFIKNPKRLINRVFAGLCGVSMLWQLTYALNYYTGSQDEALVILKVGYAAIVFISAFFGDYVLIVLKLRERLKIYVRCMYGLAAFFALLIPFTPLLIQGLYKYFWGFYPKRGIIHPVFLVYFIGNLNVAITLLVYYLFFKRKQLSALQINQIKFLLIGFSVYSIACVDFIPNYGIEIYPFGYIPAFLFISTIGFTIVRYRLLEIDTVIHRTALWLMTLVLVILPVALLAAVFMNRILSLNYLERLVLVSTVLIFFVWYYNKIKPRVDHFFRRRKYDYYKVLGEVGQKVGSELEINNIAGRLFRELKEVLYIRNGFILIQQPDKPDYVEAASIGYGQASESAERRGIELNYNSSLSKWINNHLRALEREQVEIDPRYAPVREEALSFFNRNSVEIIVPVIMEDKVNALAGIGKKDNLNAYTAKDIELLERMGRQIGVTIDNAIHHEDIVEKERLAQELKLGKEIQMALLPQEIPQIPGLSVSGFMRPAQEIGGDYYDFIALPDKERLAVIIGDVSGKGVAAGLLMSMVKATVQTLSEEEVSPKQILLRTNSLLYQQIAEQKFITLLYLLWNSSTRSLTYSSAGHEHILVYRSRERQLNVIQSGGFMLGMILDIDNFLEEKQLQLNSKDKVLLYTDGVTEAESREKERFGLQRLKDAFVKYSDKPAKEMIQSIKDEVYVFIGSHPQYDDITLVAMEVD